MKFNIAQEDSDESDPSPDLEFACNQSDHDDKNDNTSSDDNNETSQTYNTPTLSQFMGMAVPVFAQDIIHEIAYQNIKFVISKRYSLIISRYHQIQ